MEWILYTVAWMNDMRISNGFGPWIGNCEEVPKLTVGKLSADRLPTSYRQTSNRQNVCCRIDRNRVLYQINKMVSKTRKQLLIHFVTNLPIHGRHRKYCDHEIFFKYLILYHIGYCVTNRQEGLKFKLYKADRHSIHSPAPVIRNKDLNCV